jgi:hypothetical protein
MADFYPAQCSKRTSQNLASTYCGRSPRAASSMAVSRHPAPWRTAPSLACSMAVSRHPAPWRTAPRWPLHGGLKAVCSMADFSRVPLHGRFGLPSKVTASWQIWAAIKGDCSMADLGCGRWCLLYGRFGLPSKAAAAWQIWTAINGSPRVFELNGSKTPQVGHQQSVQASYVPVT